MKAEALGQGQLFPAPAPGNGQQARAVHQAAFLGRDGGQQPGAERAQQQAGHVRVARDHMQGVAALGHGALAQHLARGQQAPPHGLHVQAGVAQQQDLAVHAGVHDLAETVNRAAAQQGREILADVQAGDVQIMQPPPARQRGFIPEKGRDTVQAAHLQALVLQQLGGQDAVQAAGKKYDNVRRCSHARLCTRRTRPKARLSLGKVRHSSY